MEVQEVSEKTDHMRNVLAQRACNFILQHIATTDYANKIDGLIKQGMFYARVDPHAKWQFRDAMESDVRD